MEAKRGYVAVGFQGTLTVGQQSWELDARVATPVPRMVARVRQLLEDGVPVQVLEPRLQLGAAEAKALTAGIEAWCVEHLGTPLPVIAATSVAAMLAIDTRVNQVFDGRGVTVDEVLATLLTVLEGVPWDSIPKLKGFKPAGAASPTIEFATLLEAIIGAMTE